MIKYVLLLLAGLCIMISGCVPFGLAINDSFNINEVLNERIIINKNHSTSMFTINTQHFIMPSIKLNLTSTEIHRDNNSQQNEYQAKFRFPVVLLVKNRNNEVLYEYQHNLDWDSGSRSYQHNEVNARSGKVSVAFDLDKITISDSNEIFVSVLLKQDTFYFSSLQSASLIVYDNVHSYTSNILTGIAIVVVGIIVFIIGLVMLIIKQTTITKTISQQRASIMEQNNLNRNENNQYNSSITTSAMLCHLSTFAGLIIPFGGILGPLIMWQIKKDDDAFINRHGIAALNFHLSMAIYYFVSFLLAFVIIGFFFIMILAIADLVLTIIACIKASNGEEYRYPITIPFITYPEIASE